MSLKNRRRVRTEEVSGSGKRQDNLAAILDVVAITLFV